MKGLDTNILIRFLTRDDDRQANAVYAIFKRADEEGDMFYVSSLVVLEMLWVLESVYGIPKNDILDALDGLLRMPILKFESQPAIQGFLRSSRDSRIDLSDSLIAHCAKNSGCECVLTFDKKASKFDFFERIKS